MKSDKSDVTIVPHTHWDREWYLPFQFFRLKLVKLIDHVMEITEKHDFPFMLDGQTVVLEDYFEIKPENKNRLIKLIKSGKIAVGPWYLLPDEWLIGQESFIRNLEVSLDLARELDIPLMQVGYLPDQFGHTRAIPQIISNLTSFKAIVLWRGVGPEINTVPFRWKSEFNAQESVLGVYMPSGYGNAADLPEEEDNLIQAIQDKVEDLKQFSPTPVYLLMYGTDHQFPNPKLIPYIKLMDLENYDVDFGLLDDFVDKLEGSIKDYNFTVPEYIGEFRSSARAHLLQDTYSTRMWIKQWNQKIEDLLVHYTEPLLSYFWIFNNLDFPDNYLKLAWKWLLKNQTHDGICGCSVDQTHDEMISRFSWAESIAESQLEELNETIEKYSEKNEKATLFTFNPSNSSDIPNIVEFEYSTKNQLTGIQDQQGNCYPLQKITASEDVFFENKFSPIMLRTGFKLLPGRKIIDFYLNEVVISENVDPEVCNITLLCGKTPIGEFDVQDLKKRAGELLDSKKYKKYHVKATLGSKQKYLALAKLNPWSMNKFELLESAITQPVDTIFESTKDSVSNTFYDVDFNRNGTFNYFDKNKNILYEELHKFEDYGDKGDEYTFGRIGPEIAKVKNVKRKLISDGPVFSEIHQSYLLEIYKELSEDREKRTGSVEIPVTTKFRFYRDIPRIDISTNLINFAKDHRLRICFDLPFRSFETLTSTHFGTIKRKSSPFGDDSYAEAPSGIQAQKRYIRIHDTLHKSAVTLINKGLPEVELVEGSRLALTLLRSVGYLSRMDYEERPMHAGPFMETPGAQELNKEYTFDYSLLIHSKEDPMYLCDNHAEVFTLPSKTYLVTDPEIEEIMLQSLFYVNNPWIRISSLRNRNGKLLITLFNLNTVYETVLLQINPKFQNCQEITYDGNVKANHKINDNQFEIAFNAYEIKMFQFE